MSITDVATTMRTRFVILGSGGLEDAIFKFKLNVLAYGSCQFRYACSVRSSRSDEEPNVLIRKASSYLIGDMWTTVHRRC